MGSHFFWDVAACFQDAAERNGLAEADFEFFNFPNLISWTVLRIVDKPINSNFSEVIKWEELVINI